jgi:hypothetical protein
MAAEPPTQAVPVATLADINTRFAGLADVPAEHQQVRGVILAVAQDWHLRIKDGPAKDDALDALERAVELACKAIQAA